MYHGRDTFDGVIKYNGQLSLNGTFDCWKARTQNVCVRILCTIRTLVRSYP